MSFTKEDILTGRVTIRIGSFKYKVIGDKLYVDMECESGNWTGFDLSCHPVGWIEHYILMDYPYTYEHNNMSKRYV